MTKLKIAWSWDSPDLPLQKENRTLGSFAFEPTPLAVGNTLYTSTSLAQVAAIDGATERPKWVFNPEVYKAGRPTNLGYVHRGVGLLEGRRRRTLVCPPGTTRIYMPSMPRPAKRSPASAKKDV